MGNEQIPVTPDTALAPGVSAAADAASAQTRLVIWGNLEEGDERRVERVSRERVIALFKEVATGDLAAVDALLDRIGSGE